MTSSASMPSSAGQELERPPRPGRAPTRLRRQPAVRHFLGYLLVCSYVVLGLSAAAAQTPDVSEGAPEVSIDDVYDLLAAEATVTAASKIATKISDAPSVVTVVSRQTIATRGYRTIAEALRDVPGLYLSSNLVNDNVSVRGINGGLQSFSRVVKFLVNGSAITMEGLGGTLLGAETLPMSVIEAIEVVRGPNSALYGANAFLAVINIRTLDLSKSPQGTSLMGGYSFSRMRAGGQGWEARASVAQENASLMVALSGARHDRSGFDAGTGPTAGLYQSERTEGDISAPFSGFAQAQWRSATLGRLSAQAVYQRTSASQQYGEVTAFVPENRIKMDNLVLHVEHQLSILTDRLDLTTSVTKSSGRDLPGQKLDFGTGSSLFRRQRYTEYLKMAGEMQLTLSGLSVLAGADSANTRHKIDSIYSEVRNDVLDSQGKRVLRAGSRQVRADNGFLRISTIGAFGQVVWLPPIDSLRLTGGLRYDVNADWQLADTEDQAPWTSAWSYRLAAVYQPITNLACKVLYGTSFVAPSPSQLTQEEIGALPIIGNRRLQPQEAQTLEASVSYPFGKHFFAEVNAFWTHIENRVEFVPQGQVIVGRNVTATDTLGGELVVRAKWWRLAAEANVSVAVNRIEAVTPTPSWWQISLGDGRPDTGLLPGAPKLNGFGNISLRFPEWFSGASASLRVASARLSSVQNSLIDREAYLLPAYATVDLNLYSIDLKIGELADIDLSAHILDLLDRNPREGGYGGLDIPQLGRQMSLRLRLTF